MRVLLPSVLPPFGDDRVGCRYVGMLRQARDIRCLAESVTQLSSKTGKCHRYEVPSNERRTMLFISWLDMCWPLPEYLTGSC